MLSKSFVASIFLLALTSSVNANCVITPALGVSGDPAVGNVQHPSSAAPCGDIPIGSNLDSSSTIQADTNGQFTPSITNFATGSDGSRLIKTGKVDASGTGNSFVDASIIANGDQAPTSEGTQKLTIKLPAGIKCVGGSAKNLCLASFVTAAGDGNCVVVKQASETTSTSQNSASTDGGKTPTNGKIGDQTKQEQKNQGQTNQDQTNQEQKTGADQPKDKKRVIRKRRL